MGAAESKNNITELQSQVNQNITTFMSKNQSETSTTTTTTQDLKLKNVKAYGCQFNAQQHIDQKIQALQLFSPTNASLLEQTVNSTLANGINAASGSTTSTFSLVPSFSSSENNLTAISDIKNITKNTFKVENLNKMITTINTKQTSKQSELVIDPCGFTLYPNGPPPSVLASCNTALPCNISQTILSDVLAQQITNSIFTQMSNSQAISSIVGSISATSEAKTVDPLSAIFTSSDPVTRILGILCSSICCLVILIIILKFGSEYASKKK